VGQRPPRSRSKTSTGTPERRRWIAAASPAGPAPATVAGRSLLVPGWGQYVLGQRRAWAYLAVEAALWALSRTDTFQEGMLKAINLGGDADTVGAVYGQLAGAIYGARGIPKAWRAHVALAGDITALADSVTRS